MTISKPKKSSPVEHECDVLEVHGFDLLSHVEAMLRHVREYQREVQRLRGVLGPGQTTTSKRPPKEAVREHLKELQRAVTSFTDTLSDIDEMTSV